MATAGIFNGTNLNLKLATLPIAHATSCEISFSHSPREITSKDSGGVTERAPGKKDTTISADALYAEDHGGTKTGISVLFTAWKNRTKLAFDFTSGVTGDKKYTGDCYITDLSANAGVEENATFSISLAVDGAVTQGTS